ncbi:hypothetical protein [Helicobacter saguini]|nr:hypothetical protein [Helicobacter saguini]
MFLILYSCVNWDKEKRRGLTQQCDINLQNLRFYNPRVESKNVA